VKEKSDLPNMGFAYISTERNIDSPAGQATTFFTQKLGKFQPFCRPLN